MSNNYKLELEKAQSNTNLRKVLQSWKKNLEQSKEIKQNWTGAENFDNVFFLFFDNFFYCLSPPNFSLLLTVPNFRRS